MLGPTHRLAGALAGAGYATFALRGGWADPALMGLAAIGGSAGWASPDMDQTAPFEWARTLLGPASPLLDHRRGLTHWWALPVAAWYWGLPLLSDGPRWAAAALLLGWASHIVGDAVFGRVPLLPGWGPMVGLGLRTGGRAEVGPVGVGRFVLRVAPARVVLGLALVAVLAWPVPAVSATAQTWACAALRCAGR